MISSKDSIQTNQKAWHFILRFGSLIVHQTKCFLSWKWTGCWEAVANALNLSKIFSYVCCFHFIMHVCTQPCLRTLPSMPPVQGQWFFPGIHQGRIWGMVSSRATAFAVHLMTTLGSSSNKLSQHLLKVSPWLVLTPLQATTAALQL